MSEQVVFQVVASATAEVTHPSEDETSEKDENS